ncbi:hypothetical protein BD410DRAFT_845723 [Rickenella mellea]|uniref:Ribonuclease H1 N-terminal domain-containing protein n=1 Tax=Rickenella mellea TaxID=50990 RepID=A0A4Y7PJR8_9AGAM|nr:hypothetical protein BD410DRAFT_845723 [Rickenella mellea]
MVDLSHTSVQQNDRNNDDDDERRNLPFPRRPDTADDTDTNAFLMMIFVFLRTLLGIIQAGFAALAAAPQLVQRLAPAASAPVPANPYPFPIFYAAPHHLGERWYAVYVGTRVGVFNDWADVADATSGVSGNSQRRFGSRAEAVHSFRTALDRGHVRHMPSQPPADNTNQGETSAHFATFSDPPDLKPRPKKEESDDE